MEVRIQKYLSEQGRLSRRETEKYMKKGWVLVNGVAVTTPGTKIDPQKDIVTFSQDLENEKATLLYIAFHKPRGIITNCPNAEEREIKDLLPDTLKSVSAIGRLDKDSEGLILLSNDGIFAKRCLQSHPPHKRKYEVWIDGNLTPTQKQKIERGMTLFGKRTQPLDLKMITPNHFYMEMVEGKNRQIRRMLQKVGQQVIRLRRLSFGPIQLSSLAPGRWCALSDSDIQHFLKN